jgi:hypothetical protein
MATIRPPVGRKDRELASIVTFFLRETAERCRALAAAAEIETVRDELATLVRTLEETLIRLRG